VKQVQSNMVSHCRGGHLKASNTIAIESLIQESFLDRKAAAAYIEKH